MTDLAYLCDYGVDVKAGIARCMNDTDFYLSIIGIFLRDNVLDRARDAMKQRNYTALFDCMHELKGTSGNIGLTQVYNGAREICAMLKFSQDEGVDEVELDQLWHMTEDACLLARQGISRAVAAGAS